MPQPAKHKKVDHISASLAEAKSIFMTDFSGLSVEDITRLRREFRKAHVNYIVVKNTLAKLSAEKTGKDVLIPYLNGPTGLALALDDPIAPSRIIYDFHKNQKEDKKPKIKAALVEGQLLDQEGVEEIRQIPSREVLLAQVVSGIAAPISGFVGGLKAILSKLVYTLDAIKEKKES
ncbi:50S ribosomal protein L10 [candidate division KSB1 bacterium]|nr:50S ribosomal protein L10 [candidate division KSB1 bacterium]